MAGNSIGTLFRITTFGESHGPAVGVLIDGVRPNLRISAEGIQQELNRRRPGQSAVTTPRAEADAVEILSGIFRGKTLGTPICLLVRNKDQRPEAYRKIKDLFRPGHAGYTYLRKYGIQDYRGGGRSSGRETIGRVAAGALAKQLLSRRGIAITAYTREVDGIGIRRVDPRVIEQNPVRCPDPAAAKRMEKRILAVRKAGDSVGGIVEAVIHGCPAGLGEPVFDKLEADLGRALLSIPAVKGFEIGSGFAAARMKGSRHNDAFVRARRRGVRTLTNNAGGILGGISNGEDIVVRIAVKPPSSIPKPQRTVDTKGHRRLIRVDGRHDPCLCPRIVPVVESMCALVIADHLLRQRLLRKHSVGTIRREIDFLDDMLMVILSQRQDLVREVGRLKNSNRLPIPDRHRERDIMRQRLALAIDAGLEPEFLHQIFQIIFANSRRQQRNPG